MARNHITDGFMGFFSVGTSEAKCDVVVRQSQTTAPRHLQFYDKRLKTDILSLLYLKRDLHECDDALVKLSFIYPQVKGTL